MFVALLTVSPLAVALLRALAVALLTASSEAKCFSATLSKSFWTILMTVKSGAMGRSGHGWKRNVLQCVFSRNKIAYDTVTRYKHRD